MDREKEEGTGQQEQGSGGVGFLVKEYLCDIIEVIKDTKFDENIWKYLYASTVEEYGKRDTEEVRRGSSRCTEV